MLASYEQDMHRRDPTKPENRIICDYLKITTFFKNPGTTNYTGWGVILCLP
jgi:hypothetical protein